MLSKKNVSQNKVCIFQKSIWLIQLMRSTSGHCLVCLGAVFKFHWCICSGTGVLLRRGGGRGRIYCFPYKRVQGCPVILITMLQLFVGLLTGWLPFRVVYGIFPASNTQTVLGYKEIVWCDSLDVGFCCMSSPTESTPSVQLQHAQSIGIEQIWPKPREMQVQIQVLVVTVSLTILVQNDREQVYLIDVIYSEMYSFKVRLHVVWWFFVCLFVLLSLLFVVRLGYVRISTSGRASGVVRISSEPLDLL